MALTINSLGRYQFSINDGAGASVFEKEFEVIARGASDAAIRNANDGHLIRIPLGSVVGGTVPATQAALINALMRAVSGAPQAAPRWTDATGTALVRPDGTTVAVGSTASVGSSRDLTSADDGVTLECTATVTLTVPIGLPNSFGCAIIPSGTTSIASSGGTLLNGATDTLTRSAAANQIFAIVARSSAADSYVVTGE